MSLSRRVRAAALAAVVPAVVGTGFVAETVLAGDASAAVTVTKVELKGAQLRVEGRVTPFASFVDVSSTTSAIGARPDANGTFKAQSNTFSAPDCFVTVNDFSGSPVQTVRIPGCTPSPKPVGTPAPPSGSCVITPQPNPTLVTLGTNSGFSFSATGCSPKGPLSYSVVAGLIPTGMSVGGFQTSSSGIIGGTPSVRGTYRFTLQVTDAAGATDQENFTITVV